MSAEVLYIVLRLYVLDVQLSIVNPKELLLLELAGSCCLIWPWVGRLALQWTDLLGFFMLLRLLTGLPAFPC